MVVSSSASSSEVLNVASGAASSIAFATVIGAILMVVLTIFLSVYFWKSMKKTERKLIRKKIKPNISLTGGVLALYVVLTFVGLNGLFTIIYFIANGKWAEVFKTIAIGVGSFILVVIFVVIATMLF